MHSPTGRSNAFSSGQGPGNFPVDELSGIWAEIEAFSSRLMEGFQGLDFDFWQFLTLDRIRLGIYILGVL